MAWSVIKGSGASNTGNMSIGLPSGWAANDVAVMVVESNGAEAVTAPAGWTEAPNSPVVGTDSRLTVFWRRLTVSETTPITVTDAGDHLVGTIYCLRGAATSGDPIRTSASDVVTSASSTIAFPAVTSVQDGDLIVAIHASGRDASGSQLVAPYGGDEESFTFLLAGGDNTNTGGGGGNIVVAGIAEVAGTISGVFANMATAQLQNNLVLAVKPDLTDSATSLDKGWLGFVVDTAPESAAALHKGWLGFVVDLSDPGPPPTSAKRTWRAQVN